MAVFRVERNKGYTVMSNHHLRNKDLSLKAKGLLSQMLSLPEDWDYTLKGLSLINREQIDAIRAAIRELEQAGYIVRSRERDSQGRLRGADYVIYEQPQPVPDSPTLENPMLDNPTQEKPTLGKPTQLNKDISSKEKSITDVSITDPIPILSRPSPLEDEAAQPPERKGTEAKSQSAIEIYRQIIMDKAMPDMPFTQWENPYFTVDPPAQEQGDTFAIYQLKGGPETRDYRYEAYESLQEAGLAVDRQNYDLVYTAPLDGKTTLEDIYRTFNLDRPANFTGHSLSVSDVVVLTRSGKEEAHYCDSFGFTPVPEFFLQREKQLTPRELLTGESIQTPRGSFLVTDMSREQLEAAGYGFHHQSEDGKYLIMGNGTDAFAIPAQQESPIKAAEMTTEQNYNMIDGVLNNAPTMSELEAKAKAGEQISLFDVAEAAKAEAQKPKQPQRPAQKQKKPSIRAQLKAAKEEQQKKPPQREKAQELEV